MLIYFVVGLLAISLAAICQMIDTGMQAGSSSVPVVRLSAPFSLLAVGALVALAGVRYGIGTDYFMYERNFYRLNPYGWPDQFWSPPYEIGFLSLSQLLRSQGFGAQAMFWAISAITVSTIWFALRRMTSHIALAVGLYLALGFYFDSFNTIRQSAAMALCLLAFTFRERRFVIFLALTLFAASFHISALVFLVAVLLLRRVKPSRVFWVVVAITTSLAFSVLRLSGGAVRLIAVFNSRYETYFEQSQSGAMAGSGVGTYLVLVSYVCLVFLSLSMERTEGESSMLVLAALSMPFTAAGTVIVPMSRVGEYFALMFVPLLAAQLGRCKSRVITRLGVIVGGSLYGLLYLISFNGIVPYSTGL